MRDALVRTGKRFLRDIKRDDLSGLAAELAYRFLFAVFPFGIFAAALTAFVAPAIGISDPTGKILGALGDNLPPDIANAIRPQLEAVIGTTQPGLLTVGAIAALWAATGGTGALIKAMNRAYEVEETRPFLPRTALAVGLTVLASIGLLAAFVTIVGTSLLTTQVVDRLRLDAGVVGAIGLLRWPVVYIGLLLAVAVLYKLAPNFKAPWRWCVAGGALFSVGWLVVTAVFGLYVANFGSYSNTYGALGGVVVLMLWFYLSAIVLVGVAALVAAAMKELRPETVDVGRDAAARASGAPVALGTKASVGAGAPATAASSASTGETARPPMPMRPRGAAGPPVIASSEPVSSVLVSGAVIAVGVAVGSIAARLVDSDRR